MNPFSFATDDINAGLSAGVMMPLDQLGLIAITGEDAADFLHNQLTSDVLNLSATQACLAGYCSPKGRLLATFLMWKNEDTLYLQCARDLQASIQKRLGMFVLRARAKLNDVSQTLRMFGLAGSACRNFLQSRFDSIPDNVWEKCSNASGVLIRVPDSMGQPRWLWILPANQHEALPPATGLTVASPALWDWLEIRAGLPRISLATQDRFVPQMINLEALDGVSFKKGCYPGQEVVARSQYLGKLKRRTALARLESDRAQAGEDVLNGADSREPVGTIVNIAASPFGGADALIELPQSLLQPDPSSSEASKRTEELMTAGQVRIELLALPYSLPDQELFVRPKL